MNRPEIKICGTVTEADLGIAIDAGADAVGIICPPKQRKRHSVGETVAVRLAALAPNGVTTVLIPRLTDADEIVRLAKAVRPDRLQLGEVEDFDLLEAVTAAAVVAEVAQVVHVDDRSAIDRAKRFAATADIIHLDSAGEEPGGTGQTHDWNISREIADAVHALGMPVILAGGLNRDNVAEAIETVRPDGVDVETGIKGPDLAHDRQRVGAFVTAARAAFSAADVIQ